MLQGQRVGTENSQGVIDSLKRKTRTKSVSTNKQVSSDTEFQMSKNGSFGNQKSHTDQIYPYFLENSEKYKDASYYCFYINVYHDETKDLNMHFSKDRNMVNKHMKRCLASLVMREHQSKLHQGTTSYPLG